MALDREALAREGERLFRSGDLAAARECFLRLLALDPDDLEAENNLGVILLQEGRVEEARGIFEGILARDPAHGDALVNLFLVLREEGRGKDMLPHLEKALALRPGDLELQRLSAEARGAAGEVFFVLSAGLCGMETISAVLNTIPDVHCTLVTPSQLGREAWERSRDVTSGRVLLGEKIYPLITRDVAARRTCGVVSSGLIFFAPQIARDIPEARFVFILRHPLEFVRSALYRNYYGGHREDVFRPAPLKGTEGEVDWRDKSQAEKICHLWNLCQEAMAATVDLLPAGASLTLKYEDLFSKPREWERLFKFLGLPGPPGRLAETAALRRGEVKTTGRFPRVRDWSPSFRGLIEDACRVWGVRHGYLEPCGQGGKGVKRKGSGRRVPLVTVGLPLYSGGTTLAGAIEGILAQDFRDFELIVSDHGRDPFVEEVARHYEKMDHRVRFVQSDDRGDYLGVHNLARMIEFSESPYFMWASWDDRVAPFFISRCLSVLEKDEAVALAYPRSYVFDREGKVLGYGADALKADSDDPAERYLNVIRDLKQCNAFYGLFRRPLMRKTRSLRMKAYAHDNLFLAEISLLGKIVQIDDVLFYRRLTRNYDRSLDEHHADVIRALDPSYQEEGITLPFCRLTYAHCEIINLSPLPGEVKERLTAETIRCFRERWGGNMRYELDRLVSLVRRGIHYLTWDGRGRETVGEEAPYLSNFHLFGLLKRLQEGLFIYPERRDLWETLEILKDRARKGRETI